MSRALGVGLPARGVAIDGAAPSARTPARGAGESGASLDAVAFAEVLAGLAPRLPLPVSHVLRHGVGTGDEPRSATFSSKPGPAEGRVPRPPGVSSSARASECTPGTPSPGTRDEPPTTAESIEAAVRLAAAKPLGPPSAGAPPPTPRGFGAATTEGFETRPPAELAPSIRVDTSPLEPLAAAAGASLSLEGDIARIDVPHPRLGSVALVVGVFDGQLSVRATTPSTEMAMALRATEHALREALAERGVTLRSLRIDVASDARLRTSGDGRRVRTPRRERES
jgi:hypothetical protein